MAKLTILNPEYESGWFEGTRGLGIPLVAKADLVSGDVVTANGEKASSADATKLPIGFTGFATGEYGKVLTGNTFRTVRDSLVYMDTPKAPGSIIYLSDTAGELADVKGTVEVQVGYYIADSEENKTTSNMAVLEIRPVVTK